MPEEPANSATGQSVPFEGEPHHLEAQRRANREATRALGLDPYGLRTDALVSIAGARSRFDQAAHDHYTQHAKDPGVVDGRPVVQVAGRVVLLRDNGKLLWLQLRDASGDVQLAISQRDVPERDFAFAKLIDLGDVIAARGRVMKTKTGEVTIWCESLSPGAKCIVPPPEKHAGLADVELRYRRRYVDLWSNPETLRVFELRSAIVSTMRDWLSGRGYLEVETPMLQALAGGAAARPFITRMNALNINLYMRIAPELYLKRLLVGGLPKVFEINRNFRNEGLDKQHNPEFTMLEAYEAFGNVDTVTQMTESLVRALAEDVARRTGAPTANLPFGEHTIDYTSPFLRISYGELFERAYGFTMENTARAREALRATKPAAGPEWAKAIESMDDILVVNELFEDKEKGGEAQLDPSRPTFITHYPSAISPLVRANRENPVLADRADLFIAGMEIAPHYTELNDPDVQEQRFREQLRGLDAEKNAEEATYRTLDEDFLLALKVGMPPAGGMGLGVDRITMLLTNQRTIRDVVLFPLMRPQ